MTMAVYGLCEGCGRRAQMFLCRLTESRVFALCEICNARVSIIEHKHPDVYKALIAGLGSQAAQAQFGGVEITKDEVYDEVLRLRGLKNNQEFYRPIRAPMYYGENPLIPTDPPTPKRPFDDIQPLHPIPLLGKTAEPDALPPQVADRENLCVLSLEDKIRLHVEGVCWNLVDLQTLPKPKPEDLT